MREIIIDRRFRGPPNSGNGGYVCGAMAERLGPAAEITLMAPPPVETLLELRDGEGGVLDLWHGETRVASGQAIDGTDIEPPPPVDLARAQEAGDRTPYTADDHPLPSCFVCGSGRHDDGLNIRVGAVDPARPTELMATSWTPAAEFADPDDRVSGRIVWSALDCPSGYVAVKHAEDAGGHEADILALLGRLGGVVHARPRVEETCVITARFSRQDGRKLFSQVALYAEDGTLCAAARATWIILPPDVAAKLR